MNLALAHDLETIAMLQVVVRPLLVATLLVGLWYALARAPLTVRQRLLTRSVVGAVLILWLATVWTFAALGLFERAFEHTPGAGTIAQGAILVVNRRANLTPDRRPILTPLFDECGR
jgi:flagellar biosynthesis protein FliQ